MSHPSLRLIYHQPSSWYLNYPVWLFKVGRKLRYVQHNPPGNSVFRLHCIRSSSTHQTPFPARVRSAGGACLRVIRNQFNNTHIVDRTYGTIGEHNDAILLSNWTRLQFVARRHIQRLGLRRHIGNVYDSLLDDLKRDTIATIRDNWIGYNSLYDYSPDILPAIWGPAVSNHCPCPSAGRKGHAVPSVVQSVSMFSHLCSRLIDWFSVPSKENYQGTQLERIAKQ